MNTKKIFIIAVILLALVTSALVVYNLFFKKPASPEGEQAGALPSAPASRGGEEKGKTGLPGGAEEKTAPDAKPAALKIKPISQEKVLGAAIGSDGQTVKYYALSNGQVWESDFDGLNFKKISSVSLNNLIKILWSPDKEKVIGVFYDNGQVKKYSHNYTSGQSVLLSEAIGYVAWSPDSKKIAYQFSKPEEEQSNISLANPDGSSWKNIFKTRLENLIVEWPAKEKISLSAPASGLAQGLLYAINSETGDFHKVLSDLYGLSVKWSPKADKILFSTTDYRGKSPRLVLSDEQGNQTKELKLAGLADKCVWSKDDRTIFCALPQEISINATWPDDYYKGLVILKDDFYKINLETGERTKIAGSTSELSYDAQDLFLSPKEDYLFFVNRRNGLLYRIKL